MPTTTSTSKDFSRPKTGEIFKSLPFFINLLWQADRRSFSLLAALSLLRLPLGIASVSGIAILVNAITSGSTSQMWFGAFLLIGVEVANVIRQSISQRSQDRFRYHVDIFANRLALQHTARLPFATLEDPTFQRYANAYDRNNWLIVNLAQQAPHIIGNFLALVGYSTAFFLVPWPATLAVISAFILKIILLRKVSDVHWQIADMETKEGRRAIYFESYTFGDKALPSRLIGITDRFIKNWQEIMSLLLQKRLASAGLSARANFFSGLLEVTGFSSGLWFVVSDIDQGRVSVGAAAAFIGAFRQARESIDVIVGDVDWFMKQAHNLPLIKYFFLAEEESDHGHPLPPGPITIKFENVWFNYPGTQQQILKGVTFSLMPGEDVALVGLNGAGKTTLIKLLMGIYRPSRGRITVNGQNLNDLKPSLWRQTVAMLPQDMPAYDDTIQEQVLYGDQSGKMRRNRFNTALEASGLKELSKVLPKGLLTHAGRKYSMAEDQAIELSGGQRQIVAIARTLYKDAQVYIFDEPTSAVDAEKEERFFESLPEALAGRTALFVAHRFSTIRRAKRIVVMDNGKIIEDGTHEELIALAGRYAELFTLQAKLYQ